MPSQLTYLKVNKFRHVRPGSEIHFKPQFNVVVGRNGTGKTTLLDLVSALVRNSFHSHAQENFSIEFQLSDNNIVLDAALESTVVNNQTRLEFSGQLVWGGGRLEIQSNGAESIINLEGRSLKSTDIVPSKSEHLGSDLIYAILRVAARADSTFEPPGDLDEHALWDASIRLTEGTETFYKLFPAQSDQSPPGVGSPFSMIQGTFWDIPCLPRFCPMNSGKALRLPM